MKDKKNILIGALLFTIIVMAVGYAAFAQTLNINGSATIGGEWQVEIVGIESEVSGTADAGTPTHTTTTATFDATLMKPGDSATYTITVQNKGTIDAKLDSITLTPQTTTAEGGEGSDAIIYEIIDQPNASDVLKGKSDAIPAGETTTVTVKATYDPETTEIPTVKTRTFTGTLEYVQAD